MYCLCIFISYLVIFYKVSVCSLNMYDIFKYDEFHTQVRLSSFKHAYLFVCDFYLSEILNDYCVLYKVKMNYCINTTKYN